MGNDGKGSLLGTVRDPSGAAIVGAHVALKDPSGHVRDTQTDRQKERTAFRRSSAGHYLAEASRGKGFEAKGKRSERERTGSADFEFRTHNQDTASIHDGDRPVGSTESTMLPPQQMQTAMKTDTPVLLTPQSVQTVPTAVLLEQNAVLLSDATRNVAGVAQDFGFNGGTQPSLILRGFPANFSMVAGGGSGMTGMGTYYLDGTKLVGVPLNMSDAQQVDVVKGPDTVLYGRAEPGGLVNVVTAPLLPIFNVDLEEIASQWGSTRTTGKIGGRLNRSGSLLFRASGTWFADKTGRAFVRDRLGSGASA
jgi:outer membrane receptor for monomeric catechols